MYLSFELFNAGMNFRYHMSDAVSLVTTHNGESPFPFDGENLNLSLVAFVGLDSGRHCTSGTPPISDIHSPSRMAVEGRDYHHFGCAWIIRIEDVSEVVGPIFKLVRSLSHRSGRNPVFEKLCVRWSIVIAYYESQVLIVIRDLVYPLREDSVVWGSDQHEAMNIAVVSISAI